MRWFFLALLVLVVFIVSLAGFRGTKFTSRPLEFLPDMDDQPKIKAQSSSDFFADGMGARQPVSSTVPMGFDLADKPAQEGGFQPYGFTHGTDYYNTGRFGDFWGDGFPEQVEVNEAFVRRGKERYGIYCAVCHGDSGDGKGVTANFGVQNIANFHLPQFADASNPQYRTNGNLFKVITEGQGLMGGYGANIAVRDRWAIVAYVRALQKKAVKSAADSNSTTTEPAPPGAQ